MSREHYVSDGIFDGESITAFGLEWCRDEPRTISLKSAVAKILCAKHNSALSDFDGEAARLSKFLVSEVYRQPTVEARVKINGRLLEKWALKTFFNLGYLRALHREQPNAIEPPDSLIRYLYCNADIRDGIGLYHVSHSIGASSLEAGVSWNVIRTIDQPNQVVGLTFVFYGVRFAVITEPVRAEGKIQSMGLVGEFDFSKSEVAYRPTSISFLGLSAAKKSIELEW
jgi:hypothetical protein